MNRMLIGTAIAACVTGFASSARADDIVQFNGFTAAGELLVYSPNWAVLPTSMLARCTPSDLPGEESTCEPCDTGEDAGLEPEETAERKKSCALKTKWTAKKSTLVSPDKKVKIVDKTKCKKGQGCAIKFFILAMGEKKPGADSPTVEWAAPDDDWVNGKPSFFFRPDSRALVVQVTAEKESGELREKFRYLDVGLLRHDQPMAKAPAPAPIAAPAGANPYKFLAANKGVRYPVKIVSKSGGEAKVAAADGDQWMVSEKDLKPNPMSFQVGDVVFALFSNSGWYPGRVAVIEKTRIYINYDDGDVGWSPIEGVILQTNAK